MAKAKKKTIAANRNNSLKDALEKARERVQNKTESAAGGESRSTSSNTQKNTGTTTKEWLKNYSDRVNKTANTARKNIASSANRSSTFESRAAGVRDYGRNRTNNLSGAPSAEARRYTDYINRANKNGYGTGRLQKTSMSRRQQGQQDYELRKQDAEKTKAAQRREEISYLNSRKEEAAQIKRSERDERVAKRKAELTARANQHLDEMYRRAPGTSAQMQYEQELKDYNKQTRQQEIDQYNQQHLIRADEQTDIAKGTAKPTQDYSKMSLEDLLVSMYQSNDQMTQAKRLFDRQKYNTNRNIDEARREIDAEYAQYNADYMAALAEYQRRTGNFTSEQKRKLSESILKQYSGDNAVPNTYESFFGDNSERKRQEALRWANENVLASDTYYSTRQDMWNTLSEDEQNLLQSYVRDTQMNPYGAGVEMLADNYDDKKIDKIYGKLKNLGYDRDDVDEYVQRMNYAALSEEREQRIQENLAENPVLAGMGYSAESVLTNLASGVDNIQMLKSIRSGKAAERTGDILQYRPVDTNQMMLTKSTQQMRQYTGDIIENRFGGVARFAYDAAMSSADSALSTAIGTLVGGEYVAGQLVGQGATEAVSLGIMASQATANAAMQQIEAGATPQEAFQRAVIAGAIEVITEKFSVDAFINLRNSRSAKAFLTNALKSMGTEGTEEMASDVLNLVADRMTGYEKSDENNAIMNYMQQGMSYEEAKKQFGKDFLLQCFEDGLAGALSAGFGSGHAFVQGRFMGMRSAEQDIKSGSAEINAESASVLANKYNNENLRKAAESVQKKKTAANVDSMNIAIEDFIEEEIASASTVEELDQKVREIKNTEGVSTEIKSMAEYARMERVQQLNEEAGSYDSAAVTGANLLSTEEAKDILDDPVRTAQIENTDVYKASMNDAKLASMPEADAVEVIKNVVANSETPGLARNLRSRAGQDLKPGGMTATTDDGEQVGIAGYVGQQNGMPLVRTTSGRILPANMLNFDNTDFVTVVNQAAANNRQLRTEDMAEAYVDAYAQYAASDANDGGLDATQYRNAMIRPGAEGSESFVQLVNNGVAFSDIVDMIQNNEGSVNLALLKDRISIDSLRNIYNQVSQYNKERSIRAKTRGAKYTDEQQRTFVKMLSEATGREVVFASPEDMPQLIGSNGYITNDGKIYISVYADQPAVITMTHELVHSIEGTEAYQQLRDFIMEHLKDNERFQEQYERRKAQYERHTGREMSQEEIEREMIAYSTELVFRDVSSVDALVKHNRGLAGKLADFIGRFSKRLGKSIRDYEKQYGVSEESRMMGTDKATLAEFRTRLLDALEKGSEEIRENGYGEREHGSFSAKEYDAAYDQTIDDFIKNVEKEKQLNINAPTWMKHTIEEYVDSRLVTEIKNLLGIDVSDYEVVMYGDFLSHVHIRHGSSGKADSTIGDNLDVVKRIKYFLHDFDNVSLSTKKSRKYRNNDGTYAKTIEIRKSLNGDEYLLVQAVPISKNKRILMVSMFIEKGTNTSQVANIQSGSSPYGQAGAASHVVPSENNISTTEENSKKNQTNSVQHSLQRDSEGRELSEQQRRYFKDSKVVDENGSLLVMYHGTPRGGFTVFSHDLQFFTENKEYADKYQSPSATSRTAGKEATNPQTYEVYLNITNPFDIRDPETRERFIDEYVKGGYALGIDPYVEYQNTTRTGLPSWEEADNIYEWMEDNDLLDEYDGIVVDEGSYQDENGNPISRGISYVTFSPEQIKNVDNKEPTENEDIRFSLQRPIEETRDLVAVHNIKQEEFMKSASLGGFAMPSLAIVKAQAGHNQFGDISLVFDKNTIDPSKKKNKVYGGDAWTPTFPTIDRKINSAAFERIRDQLSEYQDVLDQDGIYNEISRFISEYTYEESTYRDRETIIDYAAGKYEFKQWYLAAHGKDIIERSDYTKETRTEYGDDVKWLADNVPALQALYDNRRENKEQYFATIREALTDFYQERFGFSAEEAKNVLDNTKAITLHTLVSRALKYQQGETYSSKTEFDYNGYYNAIDAAVNEDDFRNWLGSLFTKDIFEKEGLYNGKDIFTASGNRRSFEALHYEVNLENIVRAMMLQEAKGGGSLTNGNILAVSSRNYQSIDEIKADEKRLGKISDEEYEELKKEYSSRFSDIVAGLVNERADNPFIDFDTKAGVILDALRDYPNSKMGIYKEMKKYIPDTTMEVVDQIIDLCQDIAEMPTGYFEAKPQRVVTFDEVKAALVPSNVSTEVISALQDFNVPIVEYEAENDEDRTEKLNNIEQYIGQENVKFSLNKENEEAAADVITDINDPDKTAGNAALNDFPEDVTNALQKNRGESDIEKLRYSLNNDGIDDFWFTEMDDMTQEQETALSEAGSILDEGFKVINEQGIHGIDEKEAKKLAQKLVEKYGSNYSVTALADNIQMVFAYAEGHDMTNYEDLVRIMHEVAMPVINEAADMDPSEKETYDTFRKGIRTKGIRLTDKQKQEVRSVFGSVSEYRNRLMQHGILLKNDGIVLDGLVWAELVEESGYRLSDDVSDVDAPMELLEALDMMTPTIRNPYGMNNSEVAFDAALTIYTDYFENKNVKIRNELRESLEKMRDAQAAAFQDQLKQERIRMANEARITENRLRAQIQELQDAAGQVGVDEAEKDYYVNEIKRLEKKIKENNRRTEEKVSDAVMVERARQRVSRYRASERRRKTELKKQITSIAMDLNQRLARPKGQRFVPESMVRAAIEVAEAVNLDTGANKGFMTKLHQLQAAYEHLKTDPNFQYDFDERTAGNIRRLSQIFEGVSIADLDLKQLAEVKQILKEVQHQIIATNQIIREEGNIELREEAEKIHEEMAKVKGIGTKKITNTITDFTINSLNPRRFFRYISGYQKDEHLIKIGGEINHIVEDGFGELNRGQRKKMVVDQEVNQIFDHVLSQPKDLSDFSSNKIKNWIDTGLKRKDGSPVLITKGMRVSLAMHAMNEDSLRHIIYGGINVPNAKLFRSGNLSEAYNRSEVIQLVNTDHLKAAMRAGDQDTVDKIYNEGKKIIKSITDQMTDYEKQWLDASKAYFHDYSGRVINDTSLELKGYKIATMRNYFPIAVDKNFLDTNFDLILDMTVAGQGFTKERVKSFKPIYLEDVMNVVSRSKENIGNYVGFATAVRNFQKLYNYGVNGKTWKSLLNDKWGGTVVNYIENMLKDVQGARKTETTIFDKIRGNYAQAVLTLNPSVTIKQAASYPTAAATLGWKPIMKALGYVERLEKKNAVVLGRAELDLIAKYTPYLDYRSTGRAMQETADMKEAMTRSGPLSFHDLKIRHPKATKGITGWIEGMDKITVGRLWYASQYYIDQQKLPNVKKGSDAYYKRVAKVFELMVEDTQPNYTVMQRTGFSRNPNALLKQMLMFKTQTFQNLGIKFDATMNFAAAERAYRQAKKTGQDLERAKAEKKEAASDLFKAYTSQIAQALVFSAMTFAAQVFLAKPKDYRDEDDEITFASVWDRIWKDALKTLVTEIPFSNYLYEMMMSTIGGEKWYDASIPVTDFINDMQNNAQTITKALEEDDYEALVKAIGNETIDLCTYMGIPADNAIKFARGIYSRCQDISNDGKLNFNSDYELSQIYHDSSSKSGQYASLYKAIGDKNFEKKYQDAVEKEIKNLQEQEKYQNTSEEDLREQAEKNIKNGLFKEIKKNDENYQAMIEAVRTGNSSEYKKALDALLSDKSLQSLFADYDWKKSIKSSLKSDLKEDIRIEDAANARINGNIDEYKRIVNEMKKEDYDQDLLVETINSVITSKTTSSGGGSSSEEKAVGLFTTKDLQFTLDHGDVDDAEEVIEDLISTKMANGKDAEEALDSTKSSVKNQMKDAYYAAGTIEEKERITDKLLKLTYDGNKIFTNKDFNSWYEDDEELQGLITNPIYRSYARGDMATHNSLINEEFKELVAQGKDAKEITRALRSDVTSSNHWKQKYKEAYDRGDTATMAQIESYIYSVTVNGQRLYDDGYCYKYWRK